MLDFPAEDNLSEWNPEGAGKKAMDKEPDDTTEESKDEKKEEEDGKEKKW